MKWLDVAGAPASGKSTLCDWHSPRKIAREACAPPEWDNFMRCAEDLLARVDSEECATIFHHYAGKIAAVAEMPGETYINTGLAQAGLEIGWRLGPGTVVDYFSLMPVSLGVVFLHADAETLKRRNRARVRDRAHMVAGMEAARAIAAAALRARQVPVREVDTTHSIEAGRAQVLEAAWIA